MSDQNWLFLSLLLVTITIITSYLLVRLSARFSAQNNIVDAASSAPNRKFQTQPIPLMGLTGSIILCLFLMGIFWLETKFNLLGLGNYLSTGLFYPFRLIWVLVGALIICLAGFLDDKFILPAKKYVPIVFLGLVVAVFAGDLKIDAFSYPFDYINLDYFPFSQNLLAFIWIGACLTATKFLDGHDGLVTTVGIINFLAIASVASFSQVFQPLLIVFGLIWASALLGFLPHNFPNAKIYLGEGGSTIIGFMIGVLSILSGAKVATASTIIGWFILDIILVMLFRIIKNKSFGAALKGDSNLHWHHRLRNAGLNKIQILSLTALILTITAQMGLISETQNKIWVLAGQFILLIAAFTISLKINRKKI